ncbi:GUN4 domain-containing protein [Pseudanabaena sp. PCC 6802]|uniref:GUN4 domain-containing protein n=1 Tax=Pseudanabaena sp. PCC 6802 TaxID=118173 RepID=UPI0003477A61|nr:GUN4 domain-containing protein [Pseudanabaena sp. PCC 6802]
MSSEEFLIEIVNNTGTESNDGYNRQSVVRAVDGKAIAANVNKLIDLVQHFDLSDRGGLTLDEVDIAIKISETGEVILLNGSPSSSNSALVLKFRRSKSTANLSDTASQMQQETFSSAVGIDYTRLNQLLSGGHWQQANQETWDLLCQALSKNKGSYLSVEEINRLPCQDLQTIDRLWQKHSLGRFGFSVQKQAYTASITK